MMGNMYREKDRIDIWAIQYREYNNLSEIEKFLSASSSSEDIDKREATFYNCIDGATFKVSLGDYIWLCPSKLEFRIADKDSFEYLYEVITIE